MSSLTSEQQLAVDKTGTNIIVSAGAGSGKTTVLKTRVLRELLEGVDVNKLIILTFTNNAAQEMKERIRNVINSEPSLKDQALLLDSAYITTFDSFAQSLVKKYSYLLNISRNFTIVDSAIVETEMVEMLDEIMESLYSNPTPEFKRLISDLCIKDDKEIRDGIINIYKNVTNLIDRRSFLTSYVDKHYNPQYVDNLINEYEEYVMSIHANICGLLEDLSSETINTEKALANAVSTANFVNACSIDDLIDCDFKLADSRNNTYTEQGSEIKSAISSLRKELASHTTKNKKTLITNYLSTKDYATAFVDILLKLDDELTKFKDKHNAYEFNDIALKAIELVKNHKSVREEIKNSTFEIMIDEYQDTSDIQETFISYIENNNVYMVGDIKQSIYRFRNANPYIFKNKYDSYRDGKSGFKIDLNKNFRSREEVIDDINLLFNSLMMDDIGGANYKESHQMVFGNTGYEAIQKNDNYHMEVLDYDDDSDYENDDVEAYIIADDILKRIKMKEQAVTFSNNNMVTRDISYRDFIILVDKGKNFERIKKILESKNIPVQIDKDVSVKEDDEIYILKSLINLVILIKNNKENSMEFKHYFMSIARSYISDMCDEELFDVIINTDYANTDIYKKCLKISKEIDAKSNKEILMDLIDEFDIVNKTILACNVNDRITKLEYFVNNAVGLNNFGMNIYEMSNYFNTILSDTNIDIKMPSNVIEADAVKIMTIHASKGLEYNYVYLPYLKSNFIRSGKKRNIDFSNKYGLILPYFNDGKGQTVVSTLSNNTEVIETISERIRLFYVALTRAKEKIILINSFDNEKEAPTIIDYNAMCSVKSYSDMLQLLKNKIQKYISFVNVEDLDIEPLYSNNTLTKLDFAVSNEHIEVTPNCINNQILDNKHFSKALTKVVDKSLKEKLEFGTFMHYVFEVCDLKKGNVNDIQISDVEKAKVINFLSSDEMKDISNAKIHKEHEIRFVKDVNVFHGFIDLLLEYDDHFDIIDYKLSNLNSDEYRVQLEGYKSYIESKYHKPTHIYLYSINKNIFKKLD